MLKHIKDKNMQLVYTGTKLGTKFNVKDKTKEEHHHDLTYSVKCPMKNCLESYNGETGRRLIEQVSEHNERCKRYKLKYELTNINPHISDFQYGFRSS